MVPRVSGTPGTGGPRLTGAAPVRSSLFKPARKRRAGEADEESERRALASAVGAARWPPSRFRGRRAVRPGKARSSPVVSRLVGSRRPDRSTLKNVAGVADAHRTEPGTGEVRDCCGESPFAPFDSGVPASAKVLHLGPRSRRKAPCPGDLPPGISTSDRLRRRVDEPSRRVPGRRHLPSENGGSTRSRPSVYRQEASRAFGFRSYISVVLIVEKRGTRHGYPE